MAFYPRVPDDTAASLKVIINNTRSDPDYLTRRECPYGDLFKEMIRSLIVDALEVMVDEQGEDEDVDVDPDRQLARAFRQLDRMNDAFHNFEPNEKLQFLKTKTALIEKLITLQERSSDLKAINVFRQTIMDALEDICSKDQISEFMTRMDGAAR